jgi:ribosomal protein L4
MNIQNVKNQIIEWYNQGELTRATNLIIAQNNETKELIPIFVDDTEDIAQVLDKINYEHKVTAVEVYSFDKELEPQLEEYKSWNI